MSGRRDFLRVLAGTAWLGAAAASAQPAGRVYRLGLLRPTAPAGEFMAAGFPDALRTLGWVEGQNLHIEARYAEGRVERLPALARELVALRCDAVIAVGIGAERAVREATSTVPIVMFGNFDPVALGFVASMARPGANITGVMIAPEGTLAGKRLELLKEAAPRARRIVLLVPDDPNLGQQVQETQKAAQALGMDLVLVQGMMAYGTSLSGLYQRVAVYADRIFKGALPGDLPVEQLTTFELVINLKTARALGLTLSPPLLLRVDRVIQ